jgi:uncharacterized protein
LNLTKAVTALNPIAAMVRRIGNPYDGPMTSPTTERTPALDVLRGVAVAGSLLGVIMEGIGHPMLALGYAATVALLAVDGRRLVTVFAPVGLMALTNYLMHSIICVVLSYGFGFALWWRIGAGAALAIAVAIIALQIPLSAWWLSRYRFGPVEWIWRRLTYRRPLPMRA